MENCWKGDADLSYLLLKHYDSDSSAYRDFLKLIGKMCKKSGDSKYFWNTCTRKTG
jgi:hypothetical protein